MCRDGRILRLVKRYGGGRGREGVEGGKGERGSGKREEREWERMVKKDEGSSRK